MKYTSDSSKGVSLPVSGFLIQENVSDSLIGSLCQIVEMLGLTDTQEKATKDMVKSTVRNMISFDGGARYLDPKLYSVINDVFWKTRKHYEDKGFPNVPDADYMLTVITKDAE